MTNFIKMLRDDRGAAAAEYALILAIVGAAIALAAVLLGGAIANAATPPTTEKAASACATTPARSFQTVSNPMECSDPFLGTMSWQRSGTQNTCCRPTS